MIWVRKIATALVLPVGLSVEILLVGFCLLLWTRRKRAGKILLGIGVALLMLLSCNAIWEPLLGLFEYDHPPLTERRLAKWLRRQPPGRTCWIVVLGGGGHKTDASLPATGRIGAVTLVRLVEGVRLHRRIPGSKLLLSGGAPLGRQTDAEMMADAARSIGIPPEDLLLEKDSRSTAEQAKILRGMLPADEFILVTSANHMPRSMDLFRKQGMDPIPAPTGYHARRRPDLGVLDFLPSIGGLWKANRVFYETVATVWASLRGHT